MAIKESTLLSSNYMILRLVSIAKESRQIKKILPKTTINKVVSKLHILIYFFSFRLKHLQNGKQTIFFILPKKVIRVRKKKSIASIIAKPKINSILKAKSLIRREVSVESIEKS